MADPQERAYSHAEEREIARELSRNPFTKEICEATTLFIETGSLEGFAAENRYIREHFGAEGERRWAEISKKTMEALLDAAQ